VGSMGLMRPSRSIDREASSPIVHRGNDLYIGL
jgi:hypothetical protein